MEKNASTFLMFVGIAFCVLIRDVNTSIVRLVFPESEEQEGSREGSSSSSSSSSLTAVLLYSMVTVFPFMLQTNLLSLRYNCFVGFFSVLLLMFALVYRSYEYNVSTPPPPLTPYSRFNDDVLWTTTSYVDALFAFPLVALAFLSQFNIALRPLRPHQPNPWAAS